MSVLMLGQMAMTKSSGSVGIHVREAVDGMGFSFTSFTVKCRQSQSSPQHVSTMVLGGDRRLVRHKNKCLEGSVHALALQL